MAKRFKGIKIDLVISSRQKRSVQTARILNKVIGKRILYTKLINEIERPSEIHGERYDSPNTAKINAEIIAHSEDPSWHYSDEENIFDFSSRIGKFLKFLQRRKEKSILVIAHGNVLRIIVAKLMFGEDFGIRKYYYMRFFKTINTGITELERNDGDWRLMTWNDHAHLS